MTTADVRQELQKDPFVPLRLHLASGKEIVLRYPDSAYVQQNTLLILDRLAAGSAEIGRYDVIALRLIERIEQIRARNGTRRPTKGKRKR